MRLQNFVYGFEDLEVLKSKCKDFINDLKTLNNEVFLWRGVSSPSDSPKEITPRKNRKPLDSSKEWHYSMDDVFKSKFNIYARSEGVFCKLRSPTGYGLDHMVFPIGKYYCLWSEEISDAYYADPRRTKSDYYGKDYDETAKLIIETYKKGNIRDAWMSLTKRPDLLRNEVILICNKYYIIYQDRKYDVKSYLSTL